MFNVKVTIDQESIRRKIIEAAEQAVRDKLEEHGIYGVDVKAVAVEGDNVRFSFSGEDKEVKKPRRFLKANSRCYAAADAKCFWQ